MAEDALKGISIPRIHIRHPTADTDLSNVVLGTGNEFVDFDASESPRLRHHEHDHDHDHDIFSPSEDELNLDERVRDWNENTDLGFVFGEKRLGWEERMKWYKVYAMHFLFMWNSRTFEYVSIVLVALAFPHGLTATSIRGITSTVSAMLCASAVGNWIDRAPSRLPSLLITITLNHAAIMASYICWLYWPVIAGWADETTPDENGPFSNFTKGLLYGLILLLDVVHDLSSIANKLSVERDWVPILVGPITPDIAYDLTQVNSVMVRIEQIVKLLAPSLLPLIMAFFTNRSGWILLLTGITVILWVVEIWIARLIATENAEIRAAKTPSHDLATMEDIEIDTRFSHLKPGIASWPQKAFVVLYQDPALRLKHFFSIPMWPASIAVSLLKLTVLAYSATLITHLLEVRFSLSLITVARATGSITGLASTVITPMAVRYMRRRQVRRALSGEEIEDEDGGEGKIVRAVGTWGIYTQFFSLIPVVLVLWNLSPTPATSTSSTIKRDTIALASPPVLIPLILFTFLSLSRIGHIAITLMVQEQGQTLIPPTQRSTFAGTEQSFHSACELAHWAMTVIWSEPKDFGFLAAVSLFMTGVSTAIYTVWVRGSGDGEGGRRGGYTGIALGSLIDVGDEEREGEGEREDEERGRGRVR